MDSRRGSAPAASDPVTVFAAERFWIVRVETDRTIHEYRCPTEVQARKFAETLTFAMVRWRKTPKPR